MEILRVHKEIEDHNIVLQQLQEQEIHQESICYIIRDNLEHYLSHRAFVTYDTYLRGSLREQDRKIYELELNNADISEI